MDKDDSIELDRQHPRSLLARIEHNQAATRVFWFFVGLYCGAIVGAVVLIPILKQ